MDESRKAFEEWFMEKHDIAAGVLNYCHDAVSMSWSAWQASRAAIEIKLPTELQLKKYACSDCISVTLDEVENGIRAAGIKVKE